MRVLLDEQLPRDLAAELTGHDVRTVAQMGWKGIRNGDLLRRAEAHVDVFVTMDKNLEHQQNLHEVRLGVVVVRARTNRIEDLLPMIPSIQEALAAVQPGQVRRVSR